MGCVSFVLLVGRMRLRVGYVREFYRFAVGGEALLVNVVEASPAPNLTRDPSAKWDAYVSVPDPDALAAEFTSRGVVFSVPLKDTTDGLRGFELKDADGYVLFFGRPRDNSN